MLDEPTSGMSDAESLAMVERIRQTAELVGAGVLVIDHDLAFITRISDRVVVLAEGRPLAEGTPNEVRDDPAVAVAYLGSSGSSGRLTRVTERSEVPADVVDQLRSVCLGLPEAYEEQAWVGTRWRVRQRTFAHVLVLDRGWPPAYARATGIDGPACVLTFESSGAELEALERDRVTRSSNHHGGRRSSG